MNPHIKFKPEQFELYPSLVGASFDKEVASIIANAVYDRNDKNNYGNNMGGTDAPIKVYVDQKGFSHGPLENVQLEGESSYGYHLYLDKEAAKAVPNQTFARETQKAFDIDERFNRLSLRGTLMAGLVVPGLFLGFTGFGVEQIINDPGKDSNGLLAGGIVVGAMATIVAGPAFTHNLYRRALTNPNLNRRHLNRAAEHVAKLDLPPVISFAA